MSVWRICRKPYVETALDGTGGLHASGRWHFKGDPIVYTASSAALAALEALVHVNPLVAPSDLRLVAIELPDDLSTEVIGPATLPQDCHPLPAPTSLQTIESTWPKRTRTAALIVPSAVIRVEANILLNPRHPEAHQIRRIRDKPFSLDPCLL